MNQYEQEAATARTAVLFLRERGVNAAWENTGGGVMCIVVLGADADPYELTVGNDGASWGWSTYYGEQNGEWTDLPVGCDGEVLGQRITDVLATLKTEGGE